MSEMVHRNLKNIKNGGFFRKSSSHGSQILTKTNLSSSSLDLEVPLQKVKNFELSISDQITDICSGSHIIFFRCHAKH
jgi:hypothetical protein